MTPIAPITLVNVSKNGLKKGSAVSDLANSAMKEFGGVTSTKAKKVLPKPIEGDQLVKGETKTRVVNCGSSAYSC